MQCNKTIKRKEKEDTKIKEKSFWPKMHIFPVEKMV